MSTPPQKPMKRSKLTAQSPVSANLQPPVVLRPGKRDSESPLQSSRHKNSVIVIKQSSKELKISIPTVKAKADLNKTKGNARGDESLMTQAKRSLNQTSKKLTINTSESSSKAIGASFFSTCDSPEIREV